MSSPVTLPPFCFSSHCCIQGVQHGPDMITMNFLAFGKPLFSCSMSVTQPEVQLPDNLQVGDVKFIRGKMAFSPATPISDGNVLLDAILVSPNSPRPNPFRGVIAHWEYSQEITGVKKVAKVKR